MAIQRLLVTGGCGFIGTNLIRQLLLREKNYQVINIDKLGYASSQAGLAEFERNPNYQFIHLDLVNFEDVRKIFREYRPEAVLHLAAESHVDRSINSPRPFLKSNIEGTFNLLEAARESWQNSKNPPFFLHVSTDEVFGELESGAPSFSEASPFDPRSPYSASKAASDHLVQAWSQTYGLPVIITHSSNNYGPYQFPEKLIPHTLLKALHNEAIPVYGNGENIRDWIHVDDHCRALIALLESGVRGQSYNVGAEAEWRNIDLVRYLCATLDELQPRQNGQSYQELITFTKDRPGHDWRYALDTNKLRKTVDWKPRIDPELGFRQTVTWYLENRSWWEALQFREER